MRLISCSVILTVCFAAQLAAQTNLFIQKPNPTHANDNSSVEVVALFSSPPPSGFMPVRVTVVNQREKPVNLRLESTSTLHNGYGESSQMSSEFEIPSEPKTATTHDFLIPLVTVIDGSGYHQHNLSVSLSGGFGSNYGSLELDASPNHPAVLLSESLHTPNSGALDSAVSSTSSHGRYGASSFAARYNPTMLPEDWRAYSGYDTLIATENDWLSMTPAARNAILEWCRLGRHLAIYRLGQSNAGFAALDIEATPDPSDANQAPYGLGSIALKRVATPKDLDAKATVNAFYRASNPVLIRSINDDYASGWSLHDAFGERDFEYGLFIVILVLFGILVGPINLFVFAKSGKRHKLFITTPIISIATSVALVGLILIKDGIGGYGMTVSLMEVRPDHGENRAYLIQEQVSRTGVLINNSFELEESATITPVPIKNSEWARLTNSSGGAGMRYSMDFDGKHLAVSGDWFKSRSEQGQLIHAVIPTRARIELKSSTGPPVLNSTFNHAIDRLYYADESGGYWITRNLKTGSATTCSPLSKKEYHAAIDDLTKKLGARQAKALQKASRRPGHYVAITKSAPPLESFSSIDWEQHTTIITGPPTR